MEIYSYKSYIFKLVQIIWDFLMTPSSTAFCERTFSHINIIKSNLRNRMEPNTLQQHLMISIKGPKV